MCSSDLATRSTGSQVERVAGIAALVLSALGYGAGRSKIKAGGKAP